MNPRIAEIRSMAEDMRYDIQPAVRAALHDLLSKLERRGKVKEKTMKKLLPVGWMPYCRSGQGTRGPWPEMSSKTKRGVILNLWEFDRMDFVIVRLGAEQPRGRARGGE